MAGTTTTSPSVGTENPGGSAGTPVGSAAMALSASSGGSLWIMAGGAASMALVASSGGVSPVTGSGSATMAIMAVATAANPLGGRASMGLAASSGGALVAGASGAAALSLSAVAYLPYRQQMGGAARIGLAAFAAATLAQGTAPDSIRFLAFGPRDEGLLWLRNSGSVDATEWDPAALAYVEGTKRDGGTAMPEGYWESGRLPGVLRRLTRAEVEREGEEGLSLAAFTDTRPAGLPSLAPKGRRWARWDTQAQGRTFSIRVVVRESTRAVRAIDLVFQSIAGPDR